MATFTLAQVKEHNKPDDTWLIIHNKVYDVSKYLDEHPGGGALLQELAGQDATAAFEEAGHSPEASEHLQTLFIGTLPHEERAEEVEIYRPTFQSISQSTTVVTNKTAASTRQKWTRASIEFGLVAVVAAGAWSSYHGQLSWHTVQRLTSHLGTKPRPGSHFWWGVGLASVVEVSASVVLAIKAWEKLNIHDDFTKHTGRRIARPYRLVVLKPSGPIMASQATLTLPRNISSPIDAKTWRPFKLVRKTQLCSNVYRFIFALPHASDVLGLPTGQHIALRATINGNGVTRSYTPVSNNRDLGRIELLVKVYDAGLMTKHLEAMQIGDTIDIRGPKGSMQYSRQYANQIGMIAGGTGITPMFQLIREICADEEDTTTVSLLYANRSEQDILLRDELDDYARLCPNRFRVSYILSEPPVVWEGKRGYIGADLIHESLPQAGADTKVLLCGPPAMVHAMKKHLTDQGFEQPRLMSKATDQVFIF